MFIVYDFFFFLEKAHLNLALTLNLNINPTNLIYYSLSALPSVNKDLHSESLDFV